MNVRRFVDLHNNKVDMYAMGIIMFEITALYSPKKQNNKKVLKLLKVSSVMFSQFVSRSERHQAVLKLRKRRKC